MHGSQILRAWQKKLRVFVSPRNIMQVWRSKQLATLQHCFFFQPKNCVFSNPKITWEGDRFGNHQGPEICSPNFPQFEVQFQFFIGSRRWALTCPDGHRWPVFSGKWSECFSKVVDGWNHHVYMSAGALGAVGSNLVVATSVSPRKCPLRELQHPVAWHYKPRAWDMFFNAGANDWMYKNTFHTHELDYCRSSIWTLKRCNDHGTLTTKKPGEKTLVCSAPLCLPGMSQAANHRVALSIFRWNAGSATAARSQILCRWGIEICKKWKVAAGQEILIGGFRHFYFSSNNGTRMI